MVCDILSWGQLQKQCVVEGAKGFFCVAPLLQELSRATVFLGEGLERLKNSIFDAFVAREMRTEIAPFCERPCRGRTLHNVLRQAVH